MATGNPGKAVEIADLLAPFAVDVRRLGEFTDVLPDETGTTFAANAIIKAAAAAAAAGLPALADDSGLAVAALDGAPGIHSARWAEEAGGFSEAMALLDQRLRGNPDRRAAFHCALALAWPAGVTRTVEGIVEGRLVFPPRGGFGFGYDPIFVPAGDDRTFGEMDPAEKSGRSHRADAFRKLVAACFRT
ncbi:MAG: RdgB/HAM1 family non-canonical purine NTP pyrophosphatase [Rhodospirillales bacterium]|nr:RdgB/HAM1 family non-canonical purine NTP pyrophosphatase [Rhodospirillales bacterium]